MDCDLNSNVLINHKNSRFELNVKMNNNVNSPSYLLLSFFSFYTLLSPHTQNGREMEILVIRGEENHTFLKNNRRQVIKYWHPDWRPDILSYSRIRRPPKDLSLSSSTLARHPDGLAPFPEGAMHNSRLERQPFHARRVARA